MQWLSSLTLALALTAGAASAQQPIRLVTFNIRYAATSLFTGEKPWWDTSCQAFPDRCRQPHVVNQLADTAAAAPSDAVTVLGLQEVLSTQLADITHGLGSPWTFVGVGRDDGVEKGEFSPILYRNDTLTLLHAETKWLSPTPDVVSFGWGAGSRRVVAIAVFESIATGKRFLHANTHLDNVSAQARSEGIKVVLARIQAVQAMFGGTLGVTLTGDFNSVPGSDAYQTLVDSGYAADVYSLATPAQRVGPYTTTFTGFTSATTPLLIDFVFVGPLARNRNRNPFTVQRYEVLNNVVNGTYISDHRAVVTDVTLL